MVSLLRQMHPTLIPKPTSDIIGEVRHAMLKTVFPDTFPETIPALRPIRAMVYNRSPRCFMPVPYWKILNSYKEYQLVDPQVLDPFVSRWSLLQYVAFTRLKLMLELASRSKYEHLRVR